MAGLVPAIHVFAECKKDVDARIRGHDDVLGERVMKAIVIHRFGPPEVLSYEDVPDPQPRTGEIRIRIHAATVNRVLDVRLRAGTEAHYGAALPLIPGVDCAADKVYEFFFCGPPLIITGGTGSPITPQAIK